MSRQQLRSKLKKASIETRKWLYEAASDMCLPAMPFPRRRAITISSAEWQEEQATLDQPQSAFMTKLPPEIRRIVYEKALGEASIHLGVMDGELLARRCGFAECRIIKQQDKLEFVLPLLRTCRKIYSEAVEYLYTKNSFLLSSDYRELPTIEYLSYLMLPQRISQIRDLYIHWELDSNYHNFLIQRPEPMLDQWFNSWDAIRKLSGLRRLHISLIAHTDWYLDYGEIWEKSGPELLAPMKKVTAPRDFVIILPDRRCSTAVDVGNSHCIFKLPGEEQGEADADDSAA